MKIIPKVIGVLCGVFACINLKNRQKLYQKMDKCCRIKRKTVLQGAYMFDDLEFHINCKKGDIGKYVLLPGDPGRVEKIASYLDDSKQVVQTREFNIYTGYLDGEMVSVCSTGIGGPSAAIALEELSNIGGDTFIRVGTATAMDLDLLAGDIVIATGAIRRDGTSKEYMPIDFPAVSDFDVLTSLVKSARETNINHKVGVVHCKDSFYGQKSAERMPIRNNLINDWNAYIDGGALCSEMESATLFIVGNYRKVRVGSVISIASNQEREKRGLKSKRNGDTTSAIEIAISAIKKLILEDKEK